MAASSMRARGCAATATWSSSSTTTTYLTAYAHNQTLLVKEDQNVRGARRSPRWVRRDADGVQLHFEIRKQGKPIDPAKLLPPR